MRGQNQSAISLLREGSVTRRGSPGFTLIELIAVLVVIGLLLGFSPIAMSWLVAEKELESEVSRLGTLIESLRLQAVLDQAQFAIHYDTEEHRYAIQIPYKVMDEPHDPDDQPVERLVLEEHVPPDDLDWHNFPRDFKLELYEGSTKIDKGLFRVVFDSGGTVPPHSLVIESRRIQSLDEEERIRTIKVNFPGFVSYAPGKVVEDFKLTEGEVGR